MKQDSLPLKISSLPVDQADRERASGDLSHSLSVEAGAGTGKTTLLVERLLSLVRSGLAPLDQIAAITFTEKAAGELKIRLREALEKAALAAKGRELQFITQALSDLERAPISTIHSFCAGLLRERPIEAAIDPSFESLDEMGLDLLFQEAWDQWLRQEIEKKSPPLRRALALGLSLDALSSLVRRLYENRDLVASSPYPRPHYDLDSFFQELRSGIEKAWQLSEKCLRPEEDAGFQAIRALREKILDADPDSSERREIFLVRELAVKPQGNKRNWKPAAACDEQKEILKRLSEGHEVLKGAIRASVMAGLVDWLKGFLRFIQEEKNRLGVLDFQDLLLFSRDLLRRNKEVRRYFQKRIRYLLVDEFQDTDPLQAEVIFFLAEEGAAAENWEDVKVSPGRLFLVGDPKQSIYRFRRADIEIYARAKEKLNAGSEGLKAVQNFRTVPSIISWVNRVFSDLIHPSPEGFYQPAYIPLAPHSSRREAIPRPGVVLLTPPPEFNREEASAMDARESEARSIAALIAGMAGGSSEGGWRICDPREKEPRPVRYRDIALLFPALTGIGAYEEALKAQGIPYRLEGGKEFYLRQEIRSLLCCLKAVDDPADQISLVSALRSFLFGYSDEEIFLFVSSGRPLNYLQEIKGEESGFAESFSFLRRLHDRRNSRAISATIAELLSYAKAVEFSLLRRAGEQTAANLRKILDQARAFEKGRNTTYRSFVEWLYLREEEGVREGEAPWSEESEENVHLLTIHKAKGLEFPVVILANLAGQRNRSEDFIPLRRMGSFEISAGPFKTQGFDAARELEKARRKAEERRLFYVAATRARDHLVVPLFPGKKSGGFLGFLDGKLPSPEMLKPGATVDGQFIAGGGTLDLSPGDHPPLRPELEEDAGHEETPLRRREEWQECLKAAIARASEGLPLITPSGAGAFENFAGQDFSQPPEAPAGAGGAAFGLAFHGVLERLDLQGAGNLKNLCRIHAAGNGIPERAEELASLCRGLLAHPFLDRIRKAKRLFREVPFSVSYEEKIVEGKIDLLFEEPDGWVIVDYKTDDVSGEAVDKRFQMYGEQGKWYARAVANTSAGAVKEVTFFFVRAGEIRVLKDFA
jgi:ATP-dependent exoDNAse (exonuclease V) beta subunit